MKNQRMSSIFIIGYSQKLFLIESIKDDRELTHGYCVQHFVTFDLLLASNFCNWDFF